VSALGQLLDRLRRARLPPGAAAGVVAVPSTGEELPREVSFLFAELDETERKGRMLRSLSSSEAAQIESAARQESRRILEDARTEAERMAAELLATRRAGCEQRTQAMLGDASREAERVLLRGWERTPEVVEEIVERILAGAG
jgi:vacuolar-type H+-ATPase subunit H